MFQGIDNIPSNRNQRVCTSVEVDGRNRVLYIRLRWLGKVGKWYMAVDDENETPVIRGVPLLAGQPDQPANLLRALAHLELGSAFVAALSEHPSSENPLPDTLGVNGEYCLVWGDTLAE